jgi:methylaspartate mutase epsilon subunit
MVPPCIQLATAILEAVIAVSNGVRCFNVCCSQAVNVAQDLAFLKLAVPITKQYLERFGYCDVKLGTELSIYTAAFPPDRARAFGIIGLGATVAALGNATLIMVKSPDEGFALPTSNANTEAIKATRQVLNWLRGQSFLESPEIDDEVYFLEREVRCIIDRVIDLGDGNIIDGIPKAFEAGVIDVPLAPSRHCRGLILPVRDQRGAIRILDPGNIPLDEETKRFHWNRIQEREVHSGKKANYEMLIEDVTGELQQTH